MQGVEFEDFYACVQVPGCVCSCGFLRGAWAWRVGGGGEVGGGDAEGGGGARGEVGF